MGTFTLVTLHTLQYIHKQHKPFSSLSQVHYFIIKNVQHSQCAKQYKQSKIKKKELYKAWIITCLFTYLLREGESFLRS
jgi:hypothetical protein